jgi:hypothetical protein
MAAKNLEAARILIAEPSLDVNDGLGAAGAPLPAAANLQLPEVVEWLCERKDIDVNVTKKMPVAMTALMVATALTNARIVEILLRQPGIDTWVRTPLGSTALTFANMKGASEIAQMIEEHRAAHPLGFFGWIRHLV